MHELLLELEQEREEKELRDLKEETKIQQEELGLNLQKQ